MQRLTTFFTNQPTFEQQSQARQALEQGGIVLLGNQPFVLDVAEQVFLTPTAVSPKRKNISYNPNKDKLKGDTYEGGEHQRLQALMKRYHHFAKELIAQWFPEYLSLIHI